MLARREQMPRSASQFPITLIYCGEQAELTYSTAPSISKIGVSWNKRTRRRAKCGRERSKDVATSDIDREGSGDFCEMLGCLRRLAEEQGRLSECWGYEELGGRPPGPVRGWPGRLCRYLPVAQSTSLAWDRAEVSTPY